MSILINILSYILLWCLVIVPLLICILPNSVEKAYLQNKYKNYKGFTFKQRMLVLKLYRLEKQTKDNRIVVKNMKNKISEDNNIW